jgi:hypothetical protein
VSRAAGLLLSVVTLQVLLGLGTWVLRWGFAPTGFVAIADSIGQVIVRSSHMLVGVMVFGCTVVYALRVFRHSCIVAERQRRELGERANSAQLVTPKTRLTAAGGAT